MVFESVSLCQQANQKRKILLIGTLKLYFVQIVIYDDIIFIDVRKHIINIRIR